MFTVSLSGVLLLLLLQQSTLDSVNGQNINSNTLARIITFFEQNYKIVDQNGNERQYAVAIKVPISQCQAGFQPRQNNFLMNEDADNVKNTIGNQEYQVYEGKELIAAGTVRVPRRYTIHSENLLLNPTEGRPITPMQHLLNSGEDNSCTVFYTLNSPCTTVCLNESNPHNIFAGLRTWSEDSGEKVFVFKKFWNRESATREILQERFRDIINYVPLYRCENDNECYACGGQNNTTIDQHCLPNTNPENS